MSSRSSVKKSEIVIPELEDASINFKPRNIPWSEEEIAILDKYYGKVPLVILSKHLRNRSADSIRVKALKRRAVSK